MKFLLPAILTLIIVGCSSSRSPSQAVNHDESYSQAAGGNIQVVAKRYYQNKNLCIAFSLKFKSLKEKETVWSNWIVSYVDLKGVTHTVAESDRLPASTSGGNVINSQYYHEEFTTRANTCFPTDKVQKVVLQPVKLSFKIQPIEISWN